MLLVTTIPDRYIALVSMLQLLVVLLLTSVEGMQNCERGPGEGVKGPRSRPDGKFKIFLNGEPQVYNPGEMYTVTLKSLDPNFVWFSLWAEANGGNTGTLHPFGDSTTKKITDCPALITAASSVPKMEASSLWSAPASGSGCVIFKATVVVRRDLWFQEDGPLTYTICENQSQTNDEQPAVNHECCACEEAKYEVGFEGLWSRQTHPKDFPDKNMTRFSDVIGASHTAEYRFWDYGGIASEGLREVAELGSTRTLESELKSQSQHIRTIIKARGIAFPNVTSKTFAVFRVDRKHHLISLVSMMAPSPDWIVGVSGLELCQSNCKWIESKVLNLYPWDAGTDSGITYLSPKNKTDPKDHIRRITSSFPADPRSPFFDPAGEPMKPLAKLYLTRQRLYEKICEKSTDIESLEDEILPNSSEKANNLMIESADNIVDRGSSGLYGGINSASYLGTIEPVTGVDGLMMIDCKVSDWEDWGPCSVSCGHGWKKRGRRIIKNARNGGKACPRKLLKTRKCHLRPCEGGMMREEPVSEENEDDESTNRGVECVYTNWTPWSVCFPSCGLKRIQQRTRIVDRRYSPANLVCIDRMETRVCDVRLCHH